jgi:hypothetical protein
MGLDKDRKSVLSSFLDRSWTDPFSGTVYLAGVDLAANLKQIVQVGRPLNNWLPSFLHEGMHHWCCNSAVGQTIAMLEARARVRLAEFVENENDTQLMKLVLEDLIRAETVLRLYRPLAEGLALFMEFDAVPGQSENLSVPMLLAHQFFVQGESLKGVHKSEEISSRITGNLFESLIRARLTDTMERRKSNLLAQPLGCDKGGYLGGYLAVKFLNATAFAESDKFADSDLFASFLRSYFYEDFGFVAKILDERKHGESSIAEMIQYFRDRMFQFSKCDFDAEATRFENFYAHKLPDARALGGRIPFRTSPDLFTLGWNRLNRLMHELEVKQTDNDLGSRVVRQFCLPILSQRAYMRVGFVPAYVRVSKTGVLYAGLDNDFAGSLGPPENYDEKVLRIFGGSPLLSGRAEEGVPPGEGKGRVEVYVSWPPFGVFLIVTLDRKIVFRLLLRGEEAHFSHVLRTFTATAEFEESDARIRKALSDLLENVSARRSNRALDKAMQQSNDVYQAMALRTVPAHKENGCLKAMKTDGVWGLLNRDFALTRDVSRISLMGGFVRTRKGLEDLQSDLSWKPLARLSELRDYRQRTGFSLMIDENEWFHSLV